MTGDDDLLRFAAAALGVDVEQLVQLDRHELRMAFVPGSFVQLTIRNRATREILEPTIDVGEGGLASADELRARNAAAGRELGALSPHLLGLLLRHGDLPRLEVRVTRSDGSAATLVTDVDGVVALARTSTTMHVELVTEPEIPDADRENGPGGPRR